VPCLLEFLFPSTSHLAFHKTIIRQNERKKTQFEEIESESESDTGMAKTLELLDWEFKPIVVNM
jgi:hypothetical protein